jgi:HD superfamily phosphohydrolase
VADAHSEKAAQQLLKELNGWVSQQLEPYQHSYTRKVRGPKIIQDGLWGSAFFDDHEVHLLDSPLLQRLRFVSQTSLVHFTYPAATHTRFQHTLGMAIVMRRILDEIQRRRRAHPDPFAGLAITAADEANLRVASFLHDVGHGVFSHSSEHFEGSAPAMKALQ